MKQFYYFFLLIFLFSCQKKEIHSIKGLAQGTTYSILYINDEKTIQKAQIDSILEVIDLSMSNYRENSLINKVNQGELIPIDPHFEQVFVTSKRIWKESGGLFDPSIGKIINLWGFGEKKIKNTPTQAQIDSVRMMIGMDKFFIDKSKIIHRKNEFISLNFNAIAQGYTCDVIANYLKTNKIEHFLVEVGGEMLLSGKNLVKNKAWSVGIDNPLQSPENERELIETLSLSNCGLATSGNYRKVWTDSITGKKYVHTINPKTGYPQQSNLLSATVIAPTAMEADAYATTLMTMNLEEIKDFLKDKKYLKVLLLFYNEAMPDKIERYQTL